MPPILAMIGGHFNRQILGIIMNSHWKDFLYSQGATFEQEQALHFGDPAGERAAALQGEVLCPLPQYGLLRVRGEDAADFLQNQFCNDVRQVDAGHSQINGYCSPKGRVLALFRLMRHNDEYLLRLPAGILDPVRRRLQMFVLMSKVTLEDASAELASLGLSGPAAASLLERALGDAPAGIDDCLPGDGLLVVRVRGPHPRFEVHGEPAAVQALWEKLAADARPAGTAAWRLLDIHAGLPEVVEATQEAFVPQMLNLQALDALSFTKGCYPGQEVVARMRYLGKLKRRLYLAHVETDACPQPGDSLYAEGSESGQGVGKVVNAEVSPGGGIDLLAVIEIASAEQRQLRLGDADGPLLSLLELPYPLPED